MIEMLEKLKQNSTNIAKSSSITVFNWLNFIFRKQKTEVKIKPGNE